MVIHGEYISLVFQFCASFCWAIGAALAQPESIADILQLTAAVAWCLANFASLWAILQADKGTTPVKTTEL